MITLTDIAYVRSGVADHVLSGCGHWTMIEKTADFLAVVQPFLAA